ncbi:UNVERIFIED_ORG: flagellar hook-length control protein FliK [Shinella sp. XGS7]|nr:flagellar hook-length control protein FliK [Shinella sp. XGS7]
MSGLALNSCAGATGTPNTANTTSPLGGLLAVAAPAAQPAGPQADFAQAMLQQQPSLPPLPGTLQPASDEPAAEGTQPANAAVDLLSGEHPQALAQQLAAALAAQPAAGEGAPAEDKPAAELTLDPQSAYALAALGLLQPAPQAAAPVQAQVAAAALPAAAARPASDVALNVTLAEAAPKPGREIDSPSGAESAAAPLPEFGSLLRAESGAPAPVGQGSGPALEPRLALKGEPRQWQQPLMQALGDRLQLEISARSEQAVIRLDPPLLGRVEIAIRHQAGDLQVRIAASHGEVARQIQQVSDQLRQDLVQRHSGEVSVQISQGGLREGDARQAFRDGGQQQAQQEQQAQQRRPGRGLAEENPAHDEGYGLAQALAAHT